MARGAGARIVLNQLAAFVGHSVSCISNDSRFLCDALDYLTLIIRYVTSSISFLCEASTPKLGQDTGKLFGRFFLLLCCSIGRQFSSLICHDLIIAAYLSLLLGLLKSLVKALSHQSTELAWRLSVLRVQLFDLHAEILAGAIDFGHLDRLI